MKSAIIAIFLIFAVAAAQASIFDDQKWRDEYDEHRVLASYILSGLGILIGIIVCFLGYRLFRPVFFIGGFVIGGGVCFIVLWYYTSVGLVVLVCAPILTGIALGVVLVFAISAGIFCLGSILGFLLFVMVVSVRDGGVVHSQIFNWVGMGVSALIGGVIALLIQKPLIIIASAVGGSYAVVACIDRFVHGGFSTVITKMIGSREFTITASYPTYIELGCCVLLAFIGIIVQFKWTSKNVYHKPELAQEEHGYYPLTD